LVAVVALSHAPAALEKRVAAGDWVAAGRQKPIAGSDLNLSGESPTSRSNVEVVTDAHTSATRRRAAFGPMRAPWVAAFGAVVFIVIGWFAVSSKEYAMWTMLTRVAVATAAVSLVVGVATRRE
jgi:hypothetical protein